MPPARLLLWACTGLGLLWSSSAIWMEPPPLWAVVTAFAGYALLILIGVFFPGLNMYADVVTRGAAGNRSVALTFDDGPHPVTTRRVLEVLASRGAKATFFVVGHKVERYPDVVREIALAGHGLGLHSYHHDRLFSLKPPAYVARDIERTQKVIDAACGHKPMLFRAPVGFISPRTAAGARRAGVRCVGWSVRAFDGVGRASPPSVARRVSRGLEDGAIVLLHDAAEREDFAPPAIEALPDILDALERMGLKSVTLGELLGRQEQCQPGLGRSP